MQGPKRFEVRDFQRAKVYAWERKLMSDFGVVATLTLDECQELICKIAADHGHEVPTVFEGRGTKVAYYSHPEHLIKLPEWARSQVIVCHEYAHSMHRHSQYFYPAHGWQFMATYIDLLYTYAQSEIPLTKNELRGNAFSYGLCLR